MKKPFIVLSILIIICMGFTFAAQGDPGDGTVTMPSVTIPSGTCNHIAGEQVRENEIPATCTEPGSYDYVIYCTLCGEEMRRGTGIKTPVLGHDFQAGDVIAPTCTEDGYTVYTCSRCGDTQNRDITEATGHALGEWETAADGVAPTCTLPGTTTGEVRYCANCDYFETRGGEAIPALGHDYVAGTPVAATCTDKGYTQYTCSRCGDSYTADETAALGHTWDDGVITKAPTATEEGVKTFTCTRCGATRTEAIAPTGSTDPTLPEESTDYEASELPFSGDFDIRSYSISNFAVASTRVCRLDVSWNILSPKVSGYQVQYSTSSAFASGTVQTVTVKGGTKQSAVIQRMPQGKRVYVRVRAYYTDKSGTSYSKWSGTKSTTIKKR